VGLYFLVECFSKLYIVGEGEGVPMLYRSLLTAVAVVVVGVASNGVTSAQTLDDILQKHIQARGGLDSLKSLKAIRYSGKITAEGIDVPITVEQKRPSSLRVTFIDQGLPGVQAYDGKTGWTIRPSTVKRAPEPMDPEALDVTIEQADFDGPLVDYKQKGNSIVLVGREAVQGKNAFKLKLTLSSGVVSFVYVDADSYLILREDVSRLVNGTQIDAMTEYGDYHKVGNLMIAHSIKTGTKDGAELEKITIDKVELNPDLDDSIFKMPSVK
jgi:outer membrane lipoprotein-sorting protein